jgi:tRNA (pseudouridine54-N1)-methyltransferase
MRHFIYFSSKAVTSGKALSNGSLMKAGRMDIALHIIISSFFLSQNFRKDVKLHLIFYGPPDPPKHIEMQITKDLEISKKDLGNFIKKILYKYQKEKKTEIFPKCFIEKKSFLKVIEELKEEGNEIFILDKNGEDIRKIGISKNCVFIIGDHNGLPKKEIRRLRKEIKTVSIGPKIYFASQTVSIINNELDRRSV